MGISQYDAKEKQGIIISEGKVVSGPHSSDIIGQTLNRGQSSLFCNGSKFFSGQLELNVASPLQKTYG